jgi:competence protein ComGC
MKTAHITSSRRGFTLVEIMIIAGIIGLIAIIAIPNFIRARQTGQRNACIANLKQLETALNVWAIDNKKAATDSYSLIDGDLDNYIKGSRLPLCPAGGTYVAGTNITSSPTCTRSTFGHTL